VGRAAALVLGAGRGIDIEIVGQRSGPQRRADVHVPGQRGRAAIAADLGSRECVGLVVGAEAAMFLRDRDAEQAGAMQIPVVLDRKFRVAIIGGGAPCEYRLAQFAGTRDDRRLLVMEAKSAGIEDRRVDGDFVGRGCAFADLHCHL